MKKLLAVLLAVLVLGGAAFGAFAEEAETAAVEAAVEAAVDTAEAAAELAAAEITYTVVYDGNGAGAVNVPGYQTKVHGEVLTLRSTEPTRTGYTFLGWATTPTGAVEYKPGADFIANASVTLYAIWKADEYTVRFVADALGARNMPANQTKAHDQVIILSTKAPTRKGYDFLGWSMARGGAKAYDPGEAYALNGNVTLHALWAKQPGAEKSSLLYHLWWIVRYILFFGWYWM